MSIREVSPNPAPLPSYEQVPEDIWRSIFSFLDTASLFSAHQTTKKWNSILTDDSFWKKHFITYYRSSDLPFHSWKTAVLNHFYWKTVSCAHFQNLEIPQKDHPLIFQDLVKKCHFLDHNTVLFRQKDRLKIVDLCTRKVVDLPSPPLCSDYEIKNFILHQRYLFVIYSDLAIDLISLDPLDQWKTLYKKEKKENSPNFFEFTLCGENNILFTCENETFLNYEMNKQKCFDFKQQLHSKLLTSDSSLILALNNGCIFKINLQNGASTPIHPPIQQGHLTRVSFCSDKLAISYYLDPIDTADQSDDDQVSMDRTDAEDHTKWIDLTTLETTSVPQEIENGKLIDCEFLDDQFLISSYIEDCDEYYLYSYQILDLQNNQTYTYSPRSAVQEWIAKAGDFLLYIEERGAIYAYNYQKNEQTLLLNDHFIESRALIDKRLFSDKLFLFVQEELPYDSDDQAPSPGPLCYVFDPSTGICKRAKNGVYTTSANCLVVHNKHFRLIDLHTIATILSSDNGDSFQSFYDPSNNRIIVGINETNRTFEEGGDAEFSRTYSLVQWNIETNKSIQLTPKRIGHVFKIHCFGSNIYVLANGPMWNNLQIFSISTGQKAPLECNLEAELKGVGASTEAVEDKIFIRTKEGVLYCLFLTDKQLIIIAPNCTDFHLRRNFLLIEKKDSIAMIDVAKLRDKHE